ncbi:MAG: T9SS type A sorting domain-containing protein [Flavobacteriales bacterium]|nr:T9SS type A sorting domain-containing protein [Flavobacteriales bacterium]
MNRLMKLVLIALVVFSGREALAYKYSGENTDGGGATNTNNNVDQQNTRAAACAPATGLRDLEWNNVEALIETGGSMWQDRAQSLAAYEVPKVEGGSGVSALYAGALWMGGKSSDQQLKLAAITFRANGNDYWPGPLTNDGTAEVNEATCVQYDDFFVSERQDAQRHRQYYDAVLAGTVETLFPNGYAMPAYFQDFPAHGNVAAGQDLYLAPFYDYDGDLYYTPENGDYPWYDFLREINCTERRREDIVPLFGDQNFYWIFNDKGNVHSESQGQPIGMEVRAQAFAFTSNDEVNNMTFYNYVLINQGTQTLTETYFGVWVDADLGTSVDDYVGCDVQRGLGYCFNGDSNDEPSSSSPGYGENPPAVGVDFFEGPYLDNDDMDNPLTTNIIDAIDSLGIPYKGIGIGYGDGLIDNERFGMRRFVYYNNGSNPIFGEPTVPLHYYNYMNGVWKNNQKMAFGGNGVSGAGVLTDVPADYMFPDDTDPFFWGTRGVSTPNDEPWNEVTAGNLPNDRRFIQAAGPFTLEPGDYNNITFGVVWARANSGESLASVRLMQEADDKAQALFDNCFEIVSGPDAPEVTIQELDKEIILMLTNDNGLSNNFGELYGVADDQSGFDPGIPEELADGTQLSLEQRRYKFEGYLVYQLANSEVSANDLNDVSKSRLIEQCDVRNGIGNIVNFNRDSETGLIIPKLMVSGSDLGIKRSFQITEDAFAQGDSRLINHKTYYFMVIAYGYNNYQDYDVALERGQDEAYLASRKGSAGEIAVYAAVPHIVDPEAGGTTIQSSYGDGVPLTRIEGRGTGLNNVIMNPASERDILENNIAEELTFLPANGPVNVKIVDPLRVPAADFELRLVGPTDEGDFVADSMQWELTNLDNGDVYTPYNSFAIESEDVILNYGLSISWGQYSYTTNPAAEHFTDFISGTIEFKDASKPWLFGIPDQEGFTEQNWIRAGTVEPDDNTPAEEAIFSDFQDGSADAPFTDAEEVYEKVLGGSWSPFCLVSYTDVITTSGGDLTTLVGVAPTEATVSGDLSPIAPANIANIKGLNNVDVVFTSDKSKWSRVPVFEAQGIPLLAQKLVDLDEDINGVKMKLRSHPSVDKNGKAVGEEGVNVNEATLNGAQSYGMGWFPGYAIDVETGERLNMAFAEDSWLAGENGNDMIWNPTSRLYSDIGLQPLFGGQHWIYVFKNLRNELNDEEYIPRYDQGQFMFNQLSNEGLSTANWKKLFRSCTWVGSSLLNSNFELLSPEQGLIPNDCRIALRVAREYKVFSATDQNTEQTNGSLNNWLPLYRFTTKGLEATTGSSSVLTSVLDVINIVPNPYYAFSSYEQNKLDNRVKITNLPEQCVVSIYDLNGTLVRQFNKADPITSLDWDLKNFKNIPIASGTYIVHIEVPNVGEKILKWFGVMRPVDLDNF